MQRAFKGPLDAHGRQLFGHFARTVLTAATCGLQARLQPRVIGVHAQTDDVHGQAGKGDGDFRAGQVGQALLGRSRHGAVLAAELVVVGQRPQLHTVGLGPHGQGFGCEGAIGDVGVAVQVGVGQDVHPPMLSGLRRFGLRARLGLEARVFARFWAH